MDRNILNKVKRYFNKLLPPYAQKIHAGLTAGLIENLPNFVYLKDNQSEYMGCNQNFATLLGLNHCKEILQKTDTGFPWATQLRQDDFTYMHGGDKQTAEQLLSIAEAGINAMFVKVQRSLLQDEKNSLIGVLVIINDVTLLKNIERELINEKKILEAYLESGKMRVKDLNVEQIKKQDSAIHDLEYIIARMPGYVYWKNKKLEYQGCNEQLAKISNLNRPVEIVGKTDYDFGWGEEQADQFIKDDQWVMGTGKTLVSEYELPKKPEDGANIFVRTGKMPFYAENGRIIGVLAVAVDITDQKKLEQVLIEEKNKAEEANRIKTEFIHNMEHDIRTPFNGAWGIANYLWKNETDERKKEYLGDITQCAKELLDNCNSILDFSKIEAGMLAIIEKKFALKERLQNPILLWNYLYLSQLLATTEDIAKRKELVMIIKNGSIMSWAYINLPGEYDVRIKQASNQSILILRKF